MVAKRKKPVTPLSLIKSLLRRLWMWSRERSEALRRDGRKCRACGSKDGINVHHIDGINWARIIQVLREELLCHPDRLITLCRTCHDAVNDQPEDYPNASRKAHCKVSQEHQRWD